MRYSWLIDLAGYLVYKADPFILFNYTFVAGGQVHAVWYDDPANAFWIRSAPAGTLDFGERRQLVTARAGGEVGVVGCDPQVGRQGVAHHDRHPLRRQGRDGDLLAKRERE